MDADKPWGLRVKVEIMEVTSLIVLEATTLGLLIRMCSSEDGKYI